MWNRRRHLRYLCEEAGEIRAHTKGDIESYFCTYSSNCLLTLKEQDPSILPASPNTCRDCC